MINRLSSSNSHHSQFWIRQRDFLLIGGSVQACPPAPGGLSCGGRSRSSPGRTPGTRRAHSRTRTAPSGSGRDIPALRRARRGQPRCSGRRRSRGSRRSRPPAGPAAPPRTGTTGTPVAAPSTSLRATRHEDEDDLSLMFHKRLFLFYFIIFFMCVCVCVFSKTGD